MNETKLKRDLVIPAGTRLFRNASGFPRGQFSAFLNLDGERRASISISQSDIEAIPDLFGPKTDWEELRDGNPTPDDLDDELEEILGIGA